MANNTVFTTPEVSQLTGIKEGTIRSWLSRYPEVFILGTHIIKDENGKNLWTEAGLQLLKSRNNPEQATVDSDKQSAIDQFVDELLERDSEFIVQQYLLRLPSRVHQKLQQVRCNPTDKHKEAVTVAVNAIVTSTPTYLLPEYEPMLLGGSDEQG